jgi:hypothetical protein
MTVALCIRSCFVVDRLFERGQTYDIELDARYDKFFQIPEGSKKETDAEGPVASLPEPDTSKPLPLSQLPPSFLE